jgi:hypothetical protein
LDTGDDKEQIKGRWSSEVGDEDLEESVNELKEKNDFLIDGDPGWTTQLYYAHRSIAA